MARIDRIIARRIGAARTVSKSQKPRRVFDESTPRGTKFRKRLADERLPYHTPGSPWWRERFADLVERRGVAP
jgi:hypothetical protein